MQHAWLLQFSFHNVHSSESIVLVLAAGATISTTVSPAVPAAISTTISTAISATSTTTAAESEQTTCLCQVL